MSSSSTITILFTDLVGSTELTGRVGEERSDAIRRDQFGTFRAVIAAFEGKEIKNLGDGVDGRLHEHGGCVGVRGGDAAMRRSGEPAQRRRVGYPGRDQCRARRRAEDGDWFGTPVVEAARLCSAAQGGQILVTDLVRRLAGDRAGIALGLSRQWCSRGSPSR